VSDPLLVCKGVDVRYGSVQVLFGVDLEIQRNEIVALLGTNGAGKSTILKAICGLVKPSAGTVELEGKEIQGDQADKIAALGIAQMPGGKGVFPTLTVDDNLRLASWMIRKDRKRVAEAKEEVFTLFPRLAERRSAMAGNLSGGEQQMLALGQAFVTKPSLLLIDELSLGLAPTVVGQLLEVVRSIHAAGTTIVVVEQSVNVALALAERAVFMEKGQVRFVGPTSELVERPDLLRSVFLSESAGRVSAKPRERTEVAVDEPPVLECFGVTKRFGGVTAVDHVDLQVRQGEILGLIGQNGAGKTTLFDCISGFLPLEEGRIEFRGRDITDWEPNERARGRLGRSFQEARLFPSLTVAETLAVALERHLANRDPVAAALRLPATLDVEEAVAERVDELLEMMGLVRYRDALVGSLSTGTRRIVELACLLATDPRVVLLDEPSAGVAQRETEALGPLLLRVREQLGCSLVVIEHDMPLMRSLCDELVALELGATVTRGTPDEVLQHPRVIAGYLGTDDTAVNRSGARSAKPARRARTATRV
jgi:ABC-type branched-subunit amino acid transport system ATPase component